MINRLAALTAVLYASTAFATTLSPTGTAPTAVTAGGLPGGGVYLVAPTDLGLAVTQTGLNGTVTEAVYQESGTGYLDFVYQIHLTSGGGVGSLSLSGYQDGTGTNDEATYLASAVSTFHAPSGNAADQPTTTDRTPSGDIIHFDFFNLNSPDYSDLLIIHTQALSYTQSSVRLQDTGQLAGTGYTPAPEPAQVGLLLSGLFGVGLIVTRKLRTR